VTALVKYPGYSNAAIHPSGSFMRVWLLFFGVIIAVNSYAYENVFYCTYQSDKCVASSDPVRIEESEIIQLLEQVGAMEKNFIGFTDEDGTTLQFYVDAIDDIWVEIPVPAEQGSYGTQIKESDMQAIVRDLKAPYINYKTKLNLSFRAW
jgi:hypothetical protein